MREDEMIVCNRVEDVIAPIAGSEPRLCMGCGTIVSMSPKSRKREEARPEFRAFCVACAMPILRRHPASAEGGAR